MGREDDDDALALILSLSTGASARPVQLPPPRPVSEIIAMSNAYSKALADDARCKANYHCARRGVATPLRSVPVRGKQTAATAAAKKKKKKQRPRVKQ